MSFSKSWISVLIWLSFRLDIAFKVLNVWAWLVVNAPIVERIVAISVGIDTITIKDVSKRVRKLLKFLFSEMTVIVTSNSTVAIRKAKLAITAGELFCNRSNGELFSTYKIPTMETITIAASNGRLRRGRPSLNAMIGVIQAIRIEIGAIPCQK
jgi:hypothetical protein